jgi:hypothetical protein
MTDTLKHPFSAPEIKIQRARKHLHDLETETAAHFAANPPEFDMQLESTPGFLGIRTSFRIPGAPEALGAIVGDVIHNLRAALDLSACEIVKAAGQPDGDVYFPFCKDEIELDSMIKRKRFDRAGPDAVALLHELKPYHNGNAMLRVLHDLDIRDKHQALIPSAASVASPVIQMWEDDGRINPRIIGDPTTASSIALVFPPGTGVDGRPIVQTLHELVELVAGVIEAFRALANRKVGEGV